MGHKRALMARREKEEKEEAAAAAARSLAGRIPGAAQSVLTTGAPTAPFLVSFTLASATQPRRIPNRVKCGRLRARFRDLKSLKDPLIVPASRCGEQIRVPRPRRNPHAASRGAKGAARARAPGPQRGCHPGGLLMASLCSVHLPDRADCAASLAIVLFSFPQDVLRSCSWSANVAGRKRWLLFPPHEARAAGRPPQNCTLTPLVAPATSGGKTCGGGCRLAQTHAALLSSAPPLPPPPLCPCPPADAFPSGQGGYPRRRLPGGPAAPGALPTDPPRPPDRGTRSNRCLPWRKHSSHSSRG